MNIHKSFIKVKKNSRTRFRNKNKKQLYFGLSGVLVFCLIAIVVIHYVNSNIGNKDIADINGIKIKKNAVAYFYGYARSDTISELNKEYPKGLSGVWFDAKLGNKKAGEVAQELALDNATKYYAQIAKAIELGITHLNEEPFYQDNMVRMKINNTVYGPKTLSEQEVVDRYLAGVKSKIIEKLLPDSEFTEKEMSEYFDNNQWLHSIVHFIRLRKICIPYTTANKSDKKKEMEAMVHDLNQGKDFAAIQKNLYEKEGTKTPVTMPDDGVETITKLIGDQFVISNVQTMKTGQTSGVLDSGEAFYLIKCIEKNETIISYEDAKDQIIKALAEVRYSQMVNDWVKKDKKQIFSGLNYLSY